MTTYDRMRVAADIFAADALYAHMADSLHADATRLEALEKEMRKVGIGNKMRLLVTWADTLRGEGK